MTATIDDSPADQRFSAVIRARTTTDHEQAEGSTLMRDLVAGTLDRGRLADMLGQHLLVYRTLEAVGQHLRDDPVVAPFLMDGLERTPSLEHDVALLGGPDAVAAVVAHPGTAAYVDRLAATADWPGGFIAHHYTRYLGDLSGGQFIKRVVEQAYPDLDISFYRFEQVESPKALKERYRALLDEVPWDAAERERVIDEIHVAYEMNHRMFADLDAAPA